uniref:Uncharacterized protein n=1 Tax=viral metagenome TaxID=1070528 RepID=A0A6C0IVJ9_9ZZZZ
MSYLINGFNMFYRNISEYTIIILGNLTMYYDRLYKYFTVNNRYIITQIIQDKREINYIPRDNKSLVEIYYNYNNKNYINIYKSSIQFPPYKNLTSNPFDITDDSIILITMDPLQNIDDIKILDLIKQLSGPKGNFYKDTENQIGKEDIILYLNKKLNYNIALNTYIKIMYSDGNTLLL